MRRLGLRLQYDGSCYNGWQIQSAGKTIQGVLQDAILRVTGEKVIVLSAGRTDAGVHALEQIAAFDTASALNDEVIKRALNAVLPQDIRILGISKVPEGFHPRYAAYRRRYVYLIANMAETPLFLRRHVWTVAVPLDIEAMRAAARFLMGTHDFSSFRGSGCGAPNPVRTILRLDVERLARLPFLWSTVHGNFLKLTIEADAFLRHMVRNIVGTLVEVGRGRMDFLIVGTILESRDRRLSGPTAPAQGLFLEKVFCDSI